MDRIEPMFDLLETLDAAERRLGLLRASLAAGDVDSVDSLVDVVGECQAVVNMVTAVQTVAVARVAAIEDVMGEDGTVVERVHPLGYERLDAPALVSDRLGLSDQAACGRVSDAVALTTRLPGLVVAMGLGTVDLYRCSVVAAELEDAGLEVCAEVVSRVVDQLGGPCGERLSSEPSGRLRQRVRRALGSIDPKLLRVRAERARVDRELRRQIFEPGVDTWIGTYPVEQSRPAWAAIDALAQQYRREGLCSTIGQARADAHMDLLLGNVTGTFHMQVGVAMEQLLGDPTPPAPDEALVPVTGLAGAGPTHVRRAWLSELTGLAVPTRGASRSGFPSTAAASPNGAASPEPPANGAAGAVGTPPVTWSVVGCDSASGALVTPPVDPASRQTSTSCSSAYVPSARLRELVKARDGGCRFPGCLISTRFCDLDHVRPWPDGPTSADNLICLCRRHHRIKQTARWSVTMSPDGVVMWRDPSGAVRRTWPIDHLDAELRDCVPLGRPEPSAAGLMPRPGPAPAAAVDPEDPWSPLEDVFEHDLVAERYRRNGPAQADGGCRGSRLNVGFSHRSVHQRLDMVLPRPTRAVTVTWTPPRPSSSRPRHDPPPF